MLARVRQRTFGEDFGQNIWTTADVYRHWNEELAVRSSIGYFLFAPPDVNERLIEQAGFDLDRREDVTENAAAVSKRWHDARAEDRKALVQIEGEDRFAGLQQFFDIVYRLTCERRLSRFAYLALKQAAL